jgi:plasmid stabilization system protein ParE
VSFSSIILSPSALAQIREALAFTRDRFGVLKAQEYSLLIRLALRELDKNAKAGKHASALSALISGSGTLLLRTLNQKGVDYDVAANDIDPP